MNNLLGPLQDSITEMMDYHRVLDDFKFSVTDHYIRIIYGAFASPSRVARQVSGSSARKLR